ncbi:hypothetical protein EEL32_18910 [Brevibacillus laterosporus]|uniref:Uncharacterized protein n=1 Tax=Brevibacillus laterosporus TaxID=1465 RepID=A0A502H475_BRELA|nr:hypothetical protein [Brevibacillus laterosporus]QDX95592.1 hypothetical protein EEL30_27050 [Brevibacillus laterosporus]TPG69499.1 hypothetical protein EEL31_13975 [Brevibacillus laterosporus]TPG83004.1 hypothetical protein EEL32_18910 [Brevibacillus laterosporus]
MSYYKKTKGSDEEYMELSTVQSQRNEILQEEFPEGPFGAATNENKLGKATGWENDQHSTTTRFTYETRQLHQEMSRQYPGAHPTHDDPNHDNEPL